MRPPACLHMVNLDKTSKFTICQANRQHNLQKKGCAKQGWNENSAHWDLWANSDDISVWALIA